MTSGVRSLVLDVDSGKAWLALAASGSNEDGATASTSTTPRLEGCKKRSGPTPPRGRDAKAAVVRVRAFTVSASRPPSRISGPPCSLGVGEGRQQPGDPRLGGRWSLRSLGGGVAQAQSSQVPGTAPGLGRRFGTHLGVLRRLVAPFLSRPGSKRGADVTAGVGGVRPDPRRPGWTPHKGLWEEGGSGHRGAGTISITSR